MDKKNVFAICCIIAIATSALAFSNRSEISAKLFGTKTNIESSQLNVISDNQPQNNLSQTAKTTFSSTNPEPNSAQTNIPTYILYDRVFRLVISFKKKAELQKIRGERITLIQNYFKDETQLTDQQNKILEQVAIEFLQKVQPIDTQAQVLMAQVWQLFPDDLVPAGKKVPPPPPELANLQGQRNDLALSHRDRLKELLGNSKFSEFDNFVQGRFASSFQTISITPQQ